MNRLRRIEIDEKDGQPDVSFFFDGSEGPFSTREFTDGSRTRSLLDFLETQIAQFNTRKPSAVDALETLMEDETLMRDERDAEWETLASYWLAEHGNDVLALVAASLRARDILATDGYTTGRAVGLADWREDFDTLAATLQKLLGES